MKKKLFEQRISIWRLIICILWHILSWHRFSISAQVTTGVMQTRLFAGFHEDTRRVLQSLGLLRCVEADFALFSVMVWKDETNHSKFSIHTVQRLVLVRVLAQQISELLPWRIHLQHFPRFPNRFLRPCSTCSEAACERCSSPSRWRNRKGLPSEALWTLDFS